MARLCGKKVKKSLVGPGATHVHTGSERFAVPLPLGVLPRKVARPYGEGPESWPTRSSRDTIRLTTDRTGTTREQAEKLQGAQEASVLTCSH